MPHHLLDDPGETPAASASVAIWHRKRVEVEHQPRGILIGDAGGFQVGLSIFAPLAGNGKIGLAGRQRRT